MAINLLIKHLRKRVLWRSRKTCSTLSCAFFVYWPKLLMPNQFSMSFETPDSGAVLCGLNSASGAGTGYPVNPVVTPFLSLHGAALVRLGGVQYELRYSISAPCFGDRAIDIIDAVLPIVAQSDQDALEIVEVILAGHEPSEFTPAQSAGLESACA